MKFFSNEKTDDQDREPEQPEHVSSDPVAVPQQRAGSPWSDAPGAGDPADAEFADRERRDDAVEFHEPAPQPTAFGATTVGGAVAASALANPENDQYHATMKESAADDGVGDDRTVAPGDGAVGDADTRPLDDLRRDDSGDRYDGDDLVRSDEPASAPAHSEMDTQVDAGAHRLTDETDGRAGREDEALRDEGDFDSPHVVDPATGESLEGRRDEDAVVRDQDAVVKDEGDFDSPNVVGPATGDTLDATSERTFADTGAAAAAAVPVAAAAPATTGSDRFFTDSDSFTERFRDVQLRFVDSPKEATAEAATLIGEALDKLTSALKAKKDGLASNSDDTEQLRVELRGYRDILNRLSSL